LENLCHIQVIKLFSKIKLFSIVKLYHCQKIYKQNYNKLKDFIQMQLPAGFPVKIGKMLISI